MEAPIFGHGVGAGTIAGARLAGGEHTFELGEGELARIVMELGPLLGFAFIGWRVWLAISLLRYGWSNFKMTGSLLSWLLGGATLLGLISAQWGQATMLGFTVFSAGLALAALNPPPDESEQESSLDPSTPPSPVNPAVLERRRRLRDDMVSPD